MLIDFMTYNYQNEVFLTKWKYVISQNVYFTFKFVYRVREKLGHSDLRFDGVFHSYYIQVASCCCFYIMLSCAHFISCLLNCLVFIL